MQDFDDALKERLEKTQTPPDTTPRDPAVETARDTLAARLLDAGQEHTLQINRIKQIYARLEEIDGKGARIEDIRALELEFQRLNTPSPPPSYRTPMDSGGTANKLRNFWYEMFPPHPSPPVPPAGTQSERNSP